MTPTARTLEDLRRNGWTADVVERWIPRANIRRDLFTVIDIVAIRADARGCFGVQATSASNVSARVSKARQAPPLETWLRAGNRFAVVGWAKRGPRGGRKTWQPIWREMTLETLAEVPGVTV